HARFLSKKYDRAIEDYSEVLRRVPFEISALARRAAVWEAKQNYDQALVDLNELVRRGPLWASSYYRRGLFWKRRNEYQKALVDFQVAVGRAPKDTVALKEMAWFRATCPDEKFRNGGEAVELANQACDLSDAKSAVYRECVDTLAAAYAEK